MRVGIHYMKSIEMLRFFKMVLISPEFEFLGARINCNTGLGCKLTSAYCDHQRYADLQSRNWSLDRIGCLGCDAGKPCFILNFRSFFYRTARKGRIEIGFWKRGRLIFVSPFRMPIPYLGYFL